MVNYAFSLVRALFCLGLVGIAKACDALRLIALGIAFDCVGLLWIAWRTLGKRGKFYGGNFQTS